MFYKENVGTSYFHGVYITTIFTEVEKEPGFSITALNKSIGMLEQTMHIFRLGNITHASIVTSPNYHEISHMGINAITIT